MHLLHHTVQPAPTRCHQFLEKPPKLEMLLSRCPTRTMHMASCQRRISVFPEDHSRECELFVLFPIVICFSECRWDLNIIKLLLKSRHGCHIINATSKCKKKHIRSSKTRCGRQEREVQGAFKTTESSFLNSAVTQSMTQQTWEHLLIRLVNLNPY